MNFGGDYVYVGDSDEEKYDIQSSDDENGETSDSDKEIAGGSEGSILLRRSPDPPPPSPAIAKSSPESSGEKDSASSHLFDGLLRLPVSARRGSARNFKRNLKKVRKIDANVVSIDFSTLSTEATLSTGDVILCSQCKAALNKYSSLEVLDMLSTASSATASGSEGSVSRKWQCEFCGYNNTVEVFPEEIPTADVVDYFIEPGQTVPKGAEQTVIIVMDISGSMCITKEVEGNLGLKTSQTSATELAMAEMNDGDQYLPSQNRHSTYISRLDCLKAAVLDMLETMNENSSVCLSEYYFLSTPLSEGEADYVLTYEPSSGALVTFNNEVCIVGDGIKKEMWIRGDRLNDYDQIFNLASEYGTCSTIKESKESLSSKVIELQENGATALGPAVVTALACASQNQNSKIVICTDGLANIGIGNLAEGEAGLYEEISGEASGRGVPISIISIEGEGCSIESIGRMADETEGKVTIVDPLRLREDFYHILQNPLVATNVEIKIVIHKDLMLLPGSNDNTHIGNVTKESSYDFRYKVRKNIMLDKGKDGLPFQVQIAYTNAITKAKNMRVLTKLKMYTDDRDLAMQNINPDIIGAETMQSAAKLAQQGDYSRAHRKASSFKNFLRKANVSEEEQAKYENKITPFKAGLEVQLEREEEQGIQYMELSDDSEDEREYMARQSRRKANRNMDDQFSNALFSAKKTSRKFFKE